MFQLHSLLLSGSCLAVWTVWKLLKKQHKLHKDYFVTKKDVIIVDTQDQWEEAYLRLKNDLNYCKVVGLDCEWVRTCKVACLQLACASGPCVIIRLFKLNPSFPQTLKSLLADKSILKIGVAVTDDSKKLLFDYGLQVSGCVDLRNILNRVRGVFNCPSQGLGGLARCILGVELSKDKKVRCGNWESEIYSREQINYAATDAAVAVDIFLTLIMTKLQMTEKVKINTNNEEEEDANCSTLVTDLDSRPLYKVNQSWESTIQNPQFWNTASSLCQGLVDNYTSTNKLSSSNKSSVEKKGTNAYSSRKRPLWDNCRLEAPDGTLLCTCDLKKAQWYLNKNLGDEVCSDPLTVRLHFEPANRPQSSENYYLQEKENVCAVCGTNKDYVRKFVVPFEYRKYFPSGLKDHCSHDVLLLCTPCHRVSCNYDSDLRNQLAQECDAPLESGPTAKTVLDHDLQKVRSAARALKKSKETIPEHRVIELENILKKFFGVESLTEDLLNQAADINDRCTVDGFVPHGKRVVQFMSENGGLLQFQSRWRQHFVDTMNPQYLPSHWSVDYIPENWNQTQQAD
ncbi:exonuclease 3'-5' domain-containing protein 2-like isoform X2 [Physella acuta]|uniref:exonuclease 3'-5' domain-containing protein 2-like isoform X2 n=1 Tax=Physella acuta TaxID=109671 RepID=UPI0027DE68AD|nr:exonuclease 3'-5' domain-containing protein 2-like isoform X2 [Physella acuta]